MPRRRSILGQTRGQLYRAARDLGDISAASRGPGPLAKRLVRKRLYRTEGRLTRRLLRGLKL